MKTSSNSTRYRLTQPHRPTECTSDASQSSTRFKHGLSHAVTLAGQDGFDLRKAALRQLLPIALVIGVMVLLWDRIAQLDASYVYASFRTVEPWQWICAVALTIVSFWALGRYDLVVHRLADTGISDATAERAGMTAIALSQTVGMGVLSATLVRWRMLPDLSLTQAARITITVTISFLTAWAVLTSVAVLCLPIQLSAGNWIAAMVIVAAAMLACAALLRPTTLARFQLPPLRAMVAFLMLAMLDMTAAGSALWVLLPEGCDIGFATLITAYMLALGAGLISGTPGGMGGFELTLLAVLPQTGIEPLLAAVLAFRAVYYALPASVAALATILGPKQGAHVKQPAMRLTQVDGAALPARVGQAIDTAPRAEAGLLRHGRLSLIDSNAKRPFGMAAICGQSLIMVSDSFQNGQHGSSTFAHLAKLAQRSFCAPFLYKIGGQMASAARNTGWKVLPIAREAWLNPQEFSLDGSNKRQLRRKLRQADQSGVIVHEAGANLPLREMNKIAQSWALNRKGERGFSMGVWSPDTLPFARIFLAYHQGVLVGFLTLHTNQYEHVLDLMRTTTDAPDGTMHALVTTAIACAKQDGLTRFSLAAVPLGEKPSETLLLRKIRRVLDSACGAHGLRQFKSAFAPNWETLYSAAPTKFAMTIGLYDVIREIRG